MPARSGLAHLRRDLVRGDVEIHPNAGDHPAGNGHRRERPSLAHHQTRLLTQLPRRARLNALARIELPARDRKQSPRLGDPAPDKNAPVHAPHHHANPHPSLHARKTTKPVAASEPPPTRFTATGIHDLVADASVPPPTLV